MGKCAIRAGTVGRTTMENLTRLGKVGGVILSMRRAVDVSTVAYGILLISNGRKAIISINSTGNTSNKAIRSTAAGDTVSTTK